MTTIRELFSEQQPIDRPIEKVIDYRATDPDRLGREIGEYVVTRRLEDALRRLVEFYEAGVKGGEVAEVGVWVSGFYGSGKSSFTKYLGFALDPECRIGEELFLDRFAERVAAADVRQALRTVARRFPATVVMLDLASEQLVESTTATVTNVLYRKVLRQLGYSKVPKLAQLELRLEEQGQRDAFRQAYRELFPGKGDWDEIHNDDLLGPARAARLVPQFLPEEFPTPQSYREHRYQEADSVQDRAAEIIELLRTRTEREVIVFIVDEVGQYVAPYVDLMLNLDGLMRSFKELGDGKVWFLATAQQTLTEIVEKAAVNSEELYRLRDRFPIGIELDAADIREITHRRLLTKSTDGDRRLRGLHGDSGQALQLHTRLSGFGQTNGLDGDVFGRMYPFLPQHFDVVMELIRRLARRTGGTGLRSAIRVIQDLLVDASRTLSAGAVPLADREVGHLACADDIFDTLQADIGKEFPHVVEGVARVSSHRRFKDKPLATRVAKAIAALQPIDDFPRTAANIAALLYPAAGEPGLVDPCREVLDALVDTPGLGLVELRGAEGDRQPVGTGYLFLSDTVRPVQRKRDSHKPSAGEVREQQSELLGTLFDPLPAATLDNVKTVRAGLRLRGAAVAGEGADVQFQLEAVTTGSLAGRRDELCTETRTRADYRAKVFWLVTFGSDLEDLLLEACRSAYIRSVESEHDADRDVAQYLRSEKKRLERLQDAATQRLEEALLKGTFVFRSKARPAAEMGPDVAGASSGFLAEAAKDVFSHFRLAPLQAKPDQAKRFLEVERLDRMPAARDPLGLVESRGGRPAIRVEEQPLSEVLREFSEKADATGTGRLQGSVVQELFASPPYGWTKDTTRYLFAALLAAGELKFHTADGALKTPGPKAVEAVRNTASFNRSGLSLRDSKPLLEALDRAARRLESLFGAEVLPLEDHVCRAVRKHVPALLEQIGALPDRLRLLGLQGEERARTLLQSCADLLQEDAGAATGLLGAEDTPIPAEICWAKGVLGVLDDDGEELVRRASELRSELAELPDLFPNARELAADEGVAVLEEILGTDQFAERMADLRRGVSALEQVVRQRYASEFEHLAERAKEMRRRVEALPEWRRLDPEDQEAVREQLSPADLPEEPDDEKLLGAYRRLLGRLGQLPGLPDEVRRRAPSPTPVDGGDEGPETHLVPLDELPSSEVLRSPEDVERWLDAVGQRLLELVDLGPIRVVQGVRHDEEA